jgi:hypothetical protein
MRPKLAVAGTALISVFFVLTTVGCGGSASKVAAPGSSTPANPLSGRPSSGQFKKFAACMKAHGVNNYGPTSRPGGRRPWAGMKNGQRSGAGTTRSPGLVPRTGTTGAATRHRHVGRATLNAHAGSARGATEGARGLSQPSALGWRRTARRQLISHPSGDRHAPPPLNSSCAVGRRDRHGGRGSQNAIPRSYHPEHGPQSRLARPAPRNRRVTRAAGAPTRTYAEVIPRRVLAGFAGGLSAEKWAVPCTMRTMCLSASSLFQ